MLRLPRILDELRAQCGKHVDQRISVTFSPESLDITCEFCCDIYKRYISMDIVCERIILSVSE